MTNVWREVKTVQIYFLEGLFLQTLSEAEELKREGIPYFIPNSGVVGWLLGMGSFNPLLHYARCPKCHYSHGFSPAYLDENHYHHNGSIWVPFLRKLQSDQRLVNTRFDWPQNVKHLIGLSDSNAALKGKKLILADLFYDVDESNGGVLRQRYDVAQKEFGFFKETILEYGLPEKLGLNIGVISIPYSKLILENDYEHSDPRRFAFLKDRFYFNSLLK